MKRGEIAMGVIALLLVTGYLVGRIHAAIADKPPILLGGGL